MSGRAYAFAALSVLALAFGAFAGAGMLGAAEENYPLTGEVLAGRGVRRGRLVAAAAVHAGLRLCVPAGCRGAQLV